MTQKPVSEVEITNQAYERAWILLQSLMTSEQKETWLTQRYLIEPLRLPGNTGYTLIHINSSGRCRQLYPDGSFQHDLCVHPRWTPRELFPPVLDNVVTYLIWIRFNPLGWNETARVV